MIKTVRKMALKKVSILIPIMCFALGGVSFSETEKDVPRTGLIKNQVSNIRAGDNVNFEILCQLGKGEVVKIIGKRYSWFKVALPKKAYLYIKSDYLTILSEEGVGEVNAVRVNLRAGPGTKYSILGQVSKSERLKVVSGNNGWHKIEAPDGTSGWIHSSQITFRPDNITGASSIEGLE